MGRKYNLDMGKTLVYSCCTRFYDEPVQDGRIYVEPSDLFISDRMNAKFPKVFPELSLPEHEYSIWVDANIELKCEPQVLIEFLKNHDVAVFKHPFRNTIDEEIKACEGLDSSKRLAYHMGRPGELAACGIIVRRNNAFVGMLNALWWQEICAGSSRDQLSFPYTLGNAAVLINEPIRKPFESRFFKTNPHL